MKAFPVWLTQAVVVGAIVGGLAAAVVGLQNASPGISSPPQAPQVSQTPAVTPDSVAASPVPDSPVPVPSSTPLESPVAAASEQHHSLILVDQAKPGSDFFEFRERLRQAVRERDAAFVRRVAAPDIKLSFGPSLTLTKLNIDSPNAMIWQYLERAIGTGCATQPLAAANQPSRWICPHAFLAPDHDRSVDAFESIVIVGKSVNVRAAPSTSSPVVGTVSNEVLRVDQAAQSGKPEAFFKAIETNAGWKAVILPDGKRGYVSSRYAFSPIGYRAAFVKHNGQWQMTLFLAGD